MRKERNPFPGEKIVPDRLTCVQCGRIFESWYSKSRWCSRGCKAVYLTGAKR